MVGVMCYTHSIKNNHLFFGDTKKKWNGTCGMEHKTVKLPKELLNEIEKLIESHPELGYVSTSEFIKECVRKLIREEFSVKK